MSLTTTVQLRDQYIHIVVAGYYVAGSYLQLGDVVAQESERHQCNKVVLDLSNVTGTISNMDRFAAGVYASQIWKASLRTAVVVRPEEIDSFFENTAYNRGVQTVVVTTVGEANSWLGV